MSFSDKARYWSKIAIFLTLARRRGGKIAAHFVSFAIFSAAMKNRVLSLYLFLRDPLALMLSYKWQSYCDLLPPSGRYFRPGSALLLRSLLIHSCIHPILHKFSSCHTISRLLLLGTVISTKLTCTDHVVLYRKYKYGGHQTGSECLAAYKADRHRIQISLLISKFLLGLPVVWCCYIRRQRLLYYTGNRNMAVGKPEAIV